MNKHCCQSCGKICLSNDFVDGYCRACSEDFQGQKVSTTPGPNTTRSKTSATRLAEARKLIREERVALDKSRADLDKATRENLASISKLKAEAEELSRLSSSIKARERSTPAELASEVDKQTRGRPAPVADLGNEERRLTELRSALKADAERLETLRRSLNDRERTIVDNGKKIRERLAEFQRISELNKASLKRIYQEQSRLDVERSNVATAKMALATQQRNHAMLREELTRKEDKIGRLDRQMKSKEKELSAATRKLESREKTIVKKEISLKKRQQQVDNIPKSRKEFAIRVKKFEGQLQRLRKKAAQQKAEIEYLRGYSEIAEWAVMGLGAATLWPNVEHAVVVGNGPYDYTEFADYLEGQQFILAPPDTNDASIMVVGRDNWSEAELESQIEARQGLELRVYSQEMLLLAIALGRDPLDEFDFGQLAKLFASDHSALQYLIKSGFEWPNLGTDDLEDSPSREGWGIKESPLHLMGYHVGKSSDLTPRERRRILRGAYEGPLIAVPNGPYMREWGRPKTARRLWRMAHHVAHLANSQGRGKKVAGTHWAQDLRWMKSEFFRPWMKFKWPNTTVPRR